MSDNQGLEKACFEEYQHYNEYRDMLIDGEQKVSEGLDKAILAISSVALGLTFHFARSVWGADGVVSVGWLKSSWLFFGGSLVCVLASLSLSGGIYYLNRKLCDSIMKNRSQIIEDIRSGSGTLSAKIDFSERANLVRLNHLFHYIAPVCLVVGIICIGVFFNKNIGVPTNDKETSTQSKTCTKDTRQPREAHSSTPTAAATQKPNETVILISETKVKDTILDISPNKPIIPNQVPPPSPPPPLPAKG